MTNTLKVVIFHTFYTIVSFLLESYVFIDSKNKAVENLLMFGDAIEEYPKEGGK